jgi:hypothetical protein
MAKAAKAGRWLTRDPISCGAAAEPFARAPMKPIDYLMERSPPSCLPIGWSDVGS